MPRKTAPTVDVALAPLGDDVDSDDDGSTLTYSITGAPGAGEGTVVDHRNHADV